ncbi:hypothetical protein [Aureivirga sp. CE67]|uniref:hypothetical protein n=1 Tax=Aureivirga sp. CE67 TaxID=1788983 RepID=UPI0018CA4F11|nr:hypothetical protein [Aureivirga sp. CE67]
MRIQNLYSNPQKDFSLVYAVGNYIKLSLDGYKCEELLVKSENAEIKSNENCQLVLIPKQKDFITLKFYKNEQNQEVFITEEKIKVRENVEMTPILEYRHQVYKSKISLKDFYPKHSKISFTTTDLGCLDFNRDSFVKKYNILIQKKDGKLISFENIGAKIIPEAINEMKDLEVGDRMVFHNIIFLYGDKSKTIKVQPLEFEIIN